MSDQPLKQPKAHLSWREDVIPVSEQFDDPYFSIHNGLAETEHVFLGGNDLPARFCDGFHIAELGFGTGLNMLAAWKAWEEAGQSTPFTFTSFEAFPMDVTEMARALEAFPEVSPWAERFLAKWQGGGVLELDSLHLNVVIGDARATLPAWSHHADAWFLDGFSPAKNPELWGEDLLLAVADHTVDGGTAATYTAAGFVRRGLENAGFSVERMPGYGRKRHMTRATKEAK
ncbi:tRNA (5-methylaminomethyl-2-thiouridine)(34)-methyltransferase MnmD [Epibacterium ulvae]|uniref:tRNA (5-methylaminomethyl-2-thiouridine)(34)-methyltransferase MnmD n=1 Tax=Epibacterium ulvae TaxID=1156985 RepID=UPI001BFC5266|nr:tRNA (5-methylaminomethyl-2-thiouridine)(34)-methyltransferase MnmD [Epibacterium ulvae]MBT8153858.1 tRNA (5-methylaminomethyl-2-thiouridine)(34)-methyltransferase MnmD [Epibacterium ulvae]